VVTRRISEALVSLAANRWPASIRDDLRREWMAELHVLAGHGRSWAMLRYATSLAVARPVTERSAIPLGKQIWYAIRLLIVAPVLGIALFVGSLMLMNISMPAMFSNIELLSRAAYYAQTPRATLFCLLSAFLVGRLGRRWAIPSSALRSAISVTVPGFVVASLFIAARSHAEKAALHIPVYGCYFALLTIVLIMASRRLRAGRPKAAWWTAVVGAIVAADIAVTLPLLGPAREEGLSPVTAPVWLFTSLTDFGFGVIDQRGMGVFTIGDILELDGQLLVVFTGLAIGVVFAAARAAAHSPEAATLDPA